jgi:hypothetical protein
MRTTDSETHARVWKFPIALKFFGRDRAEHFQLQMSSLREFVPSSAIRPSRFLVMESVTTGSLALSSSATYFTFTTRAFHARLDALGKRLNEIRKRLSCGGRSPALCPIRALLRCEAARESGWHGRYMVESSRPLRKIMCGVSPPRWSIQCRTSTGYME